MDRGFVFKNISAYVEQFGPGDSKVKYVYTNQTVDRYWHHYHYQTVILKVFFSTFNQNSVGMGEIFLTFMCTAWEYVVVTHYHKLIWNWASTAKKFFVNQFEVYG